MGLIKLLTNHIIHRIQEISEAKSSSINRLEDGIEARELSEELKLGRSAISRYLNELNRSGVMIKINSRPVYFFSRKRIETQYKKVVNKLVFHTFEELLDHVNSERSSYLKEPFTNLIGHTSSLRKQIEQCKVAISYPPKGLPLMIFGETGVGKSFMAQLLYEYSKANGIIEENAPFITLNCAEFANNPELLTANLFGAVKGAFTGAHRDTKGIIQEADGGILFLDEVHRLNSEGQEKLFLFMDKGLFHSLGDSENWKSATVRMIFATTENPEETFLQTFLRRIPVTISIPPLRERTENERYSLICNFYKEESKNINASLELKAGVLEALMNANVRGNVGELKNIITYSCAKSYIDSIHSGFPRKIEISLKHLPEEVVNHFIIKHRGGKESFHPFYQRSIVIDPHKDMETNLKVEKPNYMIELYEKLLKITDECSQETFQTDEFIRRAILQINQHLDKLIFKRQRYKEDLEFVTIKHFLESIVEVTGINHRIRFSGNTVIALTHFIIQSGDYNYRENTAAVEYFDEILHQYFQEEVNLAESIVSEVENTFDLSFGAMDIGILALYFKGLNSSLDSNLIKAVIIAHGYSTASSIANLSNRLLREHVFEAFDMPFEVTTAEVAASLSDYLKSINTRKGVIILVDMGSLVEIENNLNYVGTGPIGILNNITTQIAIDAGEKIIKGLSVEEILSDITQTYKPIYKLIQPLGKNKKDAIITTCITGIGTAVKIKNLIEKGINGGAENEAVHVLPYDFLSLKTNGLNDPVFTEYNVLGIVGTANPYVSDKTFVAIEDIISGKDNEKFSNLLREVLPSEGIEDITHNIVKLFSLQDVINYLTILNPDMIIEHLSEVMALLEEEFHLKFSNPTRISLYIHLSCLIERLVKKSPIEDYRDLDDFQEKHQDFIIIIKRIFSQIEIIYGIEIPVSEIGYIYDIMKIRYVDLFKSD